MATWKCMRGSLACHALVNIGHSLKRFQRPVTFTSGDAGGAFGGGSDRGSTAQTLACKANVAPPKELFCNGGLRSEKGTGDRTINEPCIRILVL